MKGKRKTATAKVYGVVENGVLKRTLQRKRHFYYKYGGYAIGEGTATRDDWQVMRVDETDTGKSYEVSRTDFDEHAQRIETDYGTQYVLNMAYFTTTT